MRRRTVWAAVLVLTLLMTAVALRRIRQLESPVAEGLDRGFARHAALTLSHIGPGMVFLVLGPLQFMTGLRRRRPALHRWLGRAFLASALIVGVTALIMGPRMAIGGPPEVAATLVFGTLFLFSLGSGFAAILQRRVSDHRRWMIRAYAIGLAVGTVRPIVGIFFATSPGQDSLRGTSSASRSGSGFLAASPPPNGGFGKARELRIRSAAPPASRAMCHRNARLRRSSSGCRCC